MAKDGGSRKRKWLVILGILVVVVVLVAWFLWTNLAREVPQRIGEGMELRDDSNEEYFKYGSIGTENQDGLPFWIWLVLPKMFPNYLPGPGGWASLGFVWEQGRELPVGFSKKTIGFERVAINCAFCHSAAVRPADQPVPQILLGGPGPTYDILGYQRFLFACASDPRFTADNILGQISQIYDMPWSERLIYRWFAIPLTRKALLAQKEDFAWTNSRPDWGRGRIDPFNPVKVRILDVDPGDTIGNSDMEPIWNLRLRVENGMAFHWDGLNTDLREVFLSSALGDGATAKSLPVETLDRLQEWAMDLAPAMLEDVFPGSIDPALAALGEPIYRERCAECHAFDGEKTGEVLPLDDGAWRPEGTTHPGPYATDPHRAEMWTPESAEAYNGYGDGEPWDFSHFRSTGGYVNVPLDALWSRAPYLHNGSVPYLAELLEPPENRTPVFYRGSDVYDPVRMGFVSEGTDAERAGFRFDVSEPGNSNQGHLFGIDLTPEQKAALVEYLKTL